MPLLWVFVFPLAVGYGIVRRQLFEVRSLAKSSAAYGAATLGITGAFAFAITFADTLVARFGVSERPAQVALLFVAILLFNPLRNRMQSLVDRFFDRDRAAYRVAVREISEAMVSMLSLGEIADRILVALTDTMGVERAMVLLVDDKGKLLQPIASRGEWDDDALEDGDSLGPSDLEAPLDAARGSRAGRFRRRARPREPRGLPRRVRHARGRAAGPRSSTESTCSA